MSISVVRLIGKIIAWCEYFSSGTNGKVVVTWCSISVVVTWCSISVVVTWCSISVVVTWCSISVVVTWCSISVMGLMAHIELNHMPSRNQAL